MGKVTKTHAVCSDFLSTERGIFRDFAEYQAHRLARPTEGDLQCWEGSARRGLKHAKPGTRIWAECLAYIAACQAVRENPGLHFNSALYPACESALKVSFNAS